MPAARRRRAPAPMAVALALFAALAPAVPGPAAATGTAPVCALDLARDPDELDWDRLAARLAADPACTPGAPLRIVGIASDRETIPGAAVVTLARVLCDWTAPGAPSRVFAVPEADHPGATASLACPFSGWSAADAPR